MIRTINENEFKIKLENTYPYYLYCIRWPSQPLHVKVGYGNKYRPCSSSYSTPFGSDGKIKIWLPEQDIDKTSMYAIEQQLHSFLLEEKRCIRGNKAGREVYKIELDTICSYIDEFISRTQSQNFYYGRGVGRIPDISCPSGWNQRGVGTASWCDKWDPLLKTSHSDKSCRSDEELNGGFCYPKCKPNYYAFGSNICTPKCPDGFGDDIGISCTKKTKTRGAGKSLK